MFSLCEFWLFFVLLSVSVYAQVQDTCRSLQFRSDHILQGKRLRHHVFRSVDVIDAEICQTLCFLDSNCVSLNFKKSTSKCELNNSTFEGQKEKLESNLDYRYHGAKNACAKKPCKNKATCQTGFTDKGYRCLCTAGFKGNHCETGITECTSRTHNCSVNAYCRYTVDGYNCTCHPGYYGDGFICEQVLSCKDIFDKKISNVSNAYPLVIGNEVIDVYCHMTMAQTGNETCGYGGWTLVMKINGNKRTFHYDSSLWNNKEAFNLDGGKTGFDTQETKLPSYWNTSFSKICLGMKIGQQIKFIVINRNASSLYSLIADGQFRNTSLGRDTWKSLVGSNASLQINCNREGFNARCDWKKRSKARIGIVGNNKNNCVSCQSRIGFGTGRKMDGSITCGNQASSNGDNGAKNIKAMGYIIVQ